MDFKLWIESNDNLNKELGYFILSIKNYVKSSIHLKHGFLSFKFPDYSQIESIQQKQSLLAASTFYVGDKLTEEFKGYKGPVSTKAIEPAILKWKPKERTDFEKAMSAGQKSLPALVGKEIGLLFELEIFIYIAENYGLKTIGGFNLAEAKAETSRIESIMSGKLRGRNNLVPTIRDFVRIHAGGKPYGMGEMIYQKTIELIKDCKVDTIEFTGRSRKPSAYFKKIMTDTADIRIGCSNFMIGSISNIGWSVKATTESEVQLRSVTIIKALAILGGSKRDAKVISNMLQNPLYEEEEKKEEIINYYYKLAKDNFDNNPQKFARLLNILITGDFYTLPAFRNTARNIGQEGWGDAIKRDFYTSEEPTGKMKAKKDKSEVVVNKTKSYLRITYKTSEGNYYGTTIKFIPSNDLNKIDITANNLVS